MVPFLRQVAEHYLAAGNIERRIFIFPNRRSMAFFRKHIVDILNEDGKGAAIMAPEMMAVNDFFCALAGKCTADRISLLLKLYECHVKCQAAHGQKLESLDDFIYWGDALIGDFNEVDKYMIDAHALFVNIRDFKSICYSPDLTEEQKEAIRMLAGHFTDEKWDKAGRKLDVKENFLLVWELLGELYDSFRLKLSEEGLAYEGMLYRSLAEELNVTNAKDRLRDAFPDSEGCVFVGLNALCKSEEEILGTLTKMGLAEFCWDFSGSMVTDRSNPSSRFMFSNLGTRSQDGSAKEAFPNAFRLDPEGLGKPKIHIIDVPSAAGQAKMLPDIIRQTPEAERGLDFAIVLPDETMLMPVLADIPDEVEDINVTMGYPLSSSEWNALMRDIVAMQLHTRAGANTYFYHRHVYDIFSNGVFKSMMDEQEKQLVADIQRAARPYIPASDLRKGALFSLIFTPSGSDTATLAAYLKEVVFEMATRLNPEGKASGMEALHMECAMQYYRCVNRLGDLKLDVRPGTFAHMLDQLATGISVPFSGEPLGGMQVMGPLETRALDFRHIVLLNANDGVFPRRSSSASFIPPELRKAFGLPGYEWQDAIWAYYFYRLISRAEDVWMIYDSRSEGLSSGEESRYVKQLRYLYADRCTIDESVASCSIGSEPEEDGVGKTDEDIEKIRKGEFSASTIQKYVHCPMQFYYYFIKELYTKSEVEENLDSGMLGTVCHDTMEALLCGEEAVADTSLFDKRDKERKFPCLPRLTKDYLERWLTADGQERIRRKIQSLVCGQLHCEKVEGRDLVSVEIALSYVTKVIRRDLELIGKVGSIEIIGVEKDVSGTIAGHRFKGFIDRLDRLEDGTLRIVDYKTGNDRQNVLKAGADPKACADAFLVKGETDSKAAFQFFTYDRLIMQDPMYKGEKLQNSMYSISDIFTEGVDIHLADKAVMEETEKNLCELFTTMEDKTVRFTRTKPENCRICDYKALCGRIDM